ncbi:MAG: 4-oxalocrotonate decarboxylase [Acidimicrobiaceae bacterium]|nr:4-oxalocrotonate decarboxylase [Acidimicrobiaceae bacterium]MYE75647.1 4-oxalocrotonate decarboxylase [Acidimicrobiaceae bacterium]MYJ42043.1 4-oxalocrotonate decarboxylase [Acidimicrobiaceae bacterium]MYJ82317.1 4-oxalocrotonate decarboxylase [Acidimicrobiaceae bacterium]
MTAIDHAAWASYLLAAVDDRSAVTAITKQLDALSIDDAYAIQAALLELHLGRGDTVAGVKLGLTSAAKQEQMGVTEPVYGWVLGSSLIDGSGEVDLGELIHPRCEPEFVFVLGEDLAGPGVTGEDVLDATDCVTGGIEVIDSRYEAFSFTLPDVIADNTSAARVAIGSGAIGPRDADLTTLGCVFEVAGEVVATATGAALLGDPASCVAMLANHLGKHGQRLRAGWTILAGAPTDAKPLGAGTRARARYSHFDSVSIVGKG